MWSDNLRMIFLLVVAIFTADARRSAVQSIFTGLKGGARPGSTSKYGSKQATPESPASKRGRFKGRRGDSSRDPSVEVVEEEEDVDGETNGGVASGFASWLPTAVIEQIPTMQVKIDPTSTFKLRKTIKILRTKLMLGCDYNTQQAVWQMKSSWEDTILKGKLSIRGRELMLTKSWDVGFSENESLKAKLRLKTAVDLFSGKTYIRFGFRTEEVTRGDLRNQGFPLEKILNLSALGRGLADGGSGSNSSVDDDGHFKMELKGRVNLPTPQLEYRSGYKRGNGELHPKFDLGVGNIVVSLDEVNLVVDL
mmetsp:Transcript_75205/g.151189  ORF Transcript_75205/g.151189 Transcript_75205/m.151189 type:complete len:308 (+) Transcript_75205:64-987(+)